MYIVGSSKCVFMMLGSSTPKLVVIAVRTLAQPHFYNTVVGGEQRHTPYKTLAPTNPLFVSVGFHGDHKVVTETMSIRPPSILGILPDLISRCLSLSAQS